MSIVYCKNYIKRNDEIECPMCTNHDGGTVSTRDDDFCSNRVYHYLKTLSHFYQAVKIGDKNFEVRFNDRNYKVGDVLVLIEILAPSFHTGRYICKEVTYVLSNADYCKEGFVVMGLKDYKDERIYEKVMLIMEGDSHESIYHRPNYRSGGVQR